MNDVITTINERFSCRVYNDKPIDKEQVLAMAKAALTAPSAMGKQPWHIIAITNKELMADFNRYKSPCMFLMLKKSDGIAADFSLGAASQNLCLAAASLGLNSVVVDVPKAPFEGENADKLKSKLGWPEGYELGFGVVVGHGNAVAKTRELNMEKLVVIE